MKKLLTLTLLTLLILTGTTTVHAQEDTGYPVEEYDMLCSDAYWDLITPSDCITYYELEYPDIATGCGDLEDNDCVIYYEVLLFSSDEAEQYAGDVDIERTVNDDGSVTYTPDVKAGGEGPDWDMVVVFAFVALMFCIMMPFGDKD